VLTILHQCESLVELSERLDGGTALDAEGISAAAAATAAVHYLSQLSDQLRHTGTVAAHAVARTAEAEAAMHGEAERGLMQRLRAASIGHSTLQCWIPHCLQVLQPNEQQREDEQLEVQLLLRLTWLRASVRVAEQRMEWRGARLFPCWRILGGVFLHALCKHQQPQHEAYERADKERRQVTRMHARWSALGIRCKRT